MGAVGDPPAGALDILPWGDGGGGPNDGDQITVAAHLDAEHAEAGLLAVEGDALHAAREVFKGRVGGGSRGGQRHGAVPGVWSAGWLATFHQHAYHKCK